MILMPVNVKWDCFNSGIIELSNLEDYVFAGKLCPLA